jgi:hypothetical protein
MIENEQQLKITKRQIVAFESALEKVEQKGVHDKIRSIQIDSIKSTLEELRGEVSTYNSLKARGVNYH